MCAWKANPGNYSLKGDLYFRSSASRLAVGCSGQLSEALSKRGSHEDPSRGREQVARAEPEDQQLAQRRALETGVTRRIINGRHRL